MFPKIFHHLLIILIILFSCAHRKVYSQNSNTIDAAPKKSKNPDSSKLIEKIMDMNSPIDKIPGKVVIRLFDPLTNGLISENLKKLSDHSLTSKMDLIGISGSDALRLADQQSNGLIRERLQQSSGSLLEVLNQLSSQFPSLEKGKRQASNSMSGWTLASSKRGIRSAPSESEDALVLKPVREPEKKNFDEIDRGGFSGFYKRNFDEIDRTGLSGFRGRRNFDEIDRSGFSGFYKKANIQPVYFTPLKRNFDEIDRSGFSGFYKRNFDEIDRSGFAGFSGFRGRRNFDEIDRSGFYGFHGKRNIDANGVYHY